MGRRCRCCDRWQRKSLGKACGFDGHSQSRPQTLGYASQHLDLAEGASDEDSDSFLDARSQSSDCTTSEQNITLENHNMANSTSSSGACSPKEVVDEQFALESEWQAVKQGLESDEFARLHELRNLVDLRGLDNHAACDSAPHSQRAATLLRFLRARGGDIGQAATLFADALDWRRDFDFDNKLRAWRSEWDAKISPRSRLLHQYDFIVRLGSDRDGLPVYLHRFSQGDPGGLARELGEEVFLMHLLRILDDAFAEVQAWILRTGRIPRGMVEIYDLGNYGLVPNWIPRALAAVGPYTRFGPLLDKVFPERLRLCFILRTPAAFSMIWKLTSPLVPEATHAKLRIKGFKASSWIEEMRLQLPEAIIPIWLRVDDAVNFPHVKPWGGVVRKGHHLVGAVLARRFSDCFDVPRRCDVTFVR